MLQKLYICNVVSNIYNMKKRISIVRILLVILFIGFISLAKAGSFDELKGSFSGVLTDAVSGKPLEGAYIYFADIKLGTVSGMDGRFVINNLQEGKHLIEISHIGYVTISEEINISGKTTKNYSLQHSVVENDAVIVTGVSTATQLKKSPFQVSVIRKEELMQNATSNIIEALTQKPGISSLSTGPSISKPIIRGLGYNRVLTINDGVRQEGQQWGDEHGIEIDEASVSKVEILKGPASIIYGSDAMAGVINIITNMPVEENTMRGNILSAYQTNNRSRLFNANMAGNYSGFNWNLYGSSVRAADYQNAYDGRVYNSKFREMNVGGYGGYNGTWGYSHLLVSNFDLKAGLVEGERDEEGYFVKPVQGGGEVRANEDDFLSTMPQIPWQHIRHLKIVSDNNFNSGRNRISLNVGYQQNRREEFGNPDDLSERELFFDLKTITANVMLHLAEIRSWKISLGLNMMDQHNYNHGVEQLIPDYSLTDLGLFVYAKRTWEKTTLSAGARIDNRNLNTKDLKNGDEIKSNSFGKTFGNFSGSIGVTQEINKHWSLKLNVARGFRAPGISELASDGAHEGTLRYEYGDKNLKSETSFQVDAGVDYSTDHVVANVSAYYNYFPGFIFYRKLLSSAGTDSMVTVEGQSMNAFRFSQQGAVLAGVEASIDIHPHPWDWLHFQNTFSLVSGTFTTPVESVRYLPFIPATRLINELKADIKSAGKRFRNMYAKLELDNTFSRNNIFIAYNTETATPGYSLLNAGWGTDVNSSKGATLFSIFLSGNNLTDKAYQNHLSRLKYAPENVATGRVGVYNMGRNFTVKLNIPLNYKLHNRQR